MFSENKYFCAKILSLTVSAVGLAVMAGWIWDFTVLKSISPSWTSMKFDTAFAFLLSGITLYLIVMAHEGKVDSAQVGLSISTMMLTLLMGILLFSFVFKVHTGAEDIFVKEAPGGVKTTVPGQPSLPTIINFFIVASAGFLTMLNPGKPRPSLKYTGLAIAAIGVIALFGYAVDAPLLYYYVEGFNSAIACNTAIAFTLLGAGFLCL